MTTFNDLGLSPSLLKAIEAEGYTTPTPIQAQAIPTVAAGRDLLGIAQTGTGKTAAFALPILHRLANPRKPTPRRACRALILSPTRELASQIAESFKAYGKHTGLTVAVVFGGVSHRPQASQLQRGVDVLVATPGRLLDHMSEHNVSLENTEVFVLDEADQMLDLGFIVPIRKIVRDLPKVRQSLFFSATMPKEIGQLAAELLHNPARVEVTPVAKTADRVEQKILFIETARKRALLAELFADPTLSRTLVFTRTKRGADRVARHLEGAGVPVSAIHGNKSQGQRERALADFKAGKIRGLVATDIAARGIDVDQVSHVINFELPNIPESYVHRIGRTARAGSAGIAISLCDGEERAYLKDIERLIRQQIPNEDRRGDAALAEATASLPREGRGERGGADRGHRGEHRSRDRNRDGGRRSGHAGGGEGRRAEGRAGGGDHKTAGGEHRRTSGDGAGGAERKPVGGERPARGERPVRGQAGERAASPAGQNGHRSERRAEGHRNAPRDGGEGARGHRAGGEQRHRGAGPQDRQERRHEGRNEGSSAGQDLSRVGFLRGRSSSEGAPRPAHAKPAHGRSEGHRQGERAHAGERRGASGGQNGLQRQQRGHRPH